MRKQVLAPERVTFLLSLVAYLRDVGAATVTELSERFSMPPNLVRGLVRFLGTAGVPGETLNYQHEDLFDIDWDALEQRDLVSLTRTVAVDDAPRFAPMETAALIAGLQALTGMLGPEDAQLARATAAKLGTALGAESQAPMSVTDAPENANVPQLLAAIEADRPVSFVYRDASGSDTRRSVRPLSLTQGSGTWYLRGYCFDRAAERTFRVDQMRDLSGEAVHDDGSGGSASDGAARMSAPTAIDAVPAAAASPTEIVARVSEAALARLAGFSPEVIEQADDGRLRVRIEAWHRGTAVQVVQVLPGEVEIVSPDTARAAVREWAERALAAYGA
ncbi:WYL domain-containing protein [Leucobacter sp. USCH14]|uniref:helix-turn-helix transcriptional regulator n=1 Tax=Leucobacter sp. USCH14 TaxID=3024838 RepID=UPI0030B63034